MITELTQEEIVTNLLSSSEILKKNKEIFHLTTPLNLGEYLNNLPEEEIETQSKLKKENKDFKYTFIKDGGWNI